jgi:HNH endonuclease
MTRSGLTKEYLRSRLHYAEDTGWWTWRRNNNANVQWNAKFTGRRAGSIDPDTGYWRIRLDDVLYYAHRLAFLYMKGAWPKNEVDHRNLDRSDCSWSNLREATHSDNATNKVRGSVNTSGYKGVSKHSDGKWVAEFRIYGRRYREYGFATPQEAHQTYVELVKKYGGEFGRIA